jgi:hypothetical protein
MCMKSRRWVACNEGELNFWLQDHQDARTTGFLWDYQAQFNPVVSGGEWSYHHQTDEFNLEARIPRIIV